MNASAYVWLETPEHGDEDAASKAISRLRGSAMGTADVTGGNVLSGQCILLKRVVR